MLVPSLRLDRYELSLATLCVLSVGCDGGSRTDRCELGKEARLTIDVNSQASSVLDGTVTVFGPHGIASVVGTETEAFAPTGPYRIVAEDLVDSYGLVHNLVEAAVRDSAFCLTDGENRVVEVNYAMVPTSGHLWLTSNGISALQSFGDGQLEEGEAGGQPDFLNAAVGTTVTFDRRGNLWTDGEEPGPVIKRFSAVDLFTLITPTFDIGLQVPALSCSPAVSHIAFDFQGNAWIASACSGAIFEIVAADLVSSGSVQPRVSLGGVGAPTSIAFDQHGNLWFSEPAGGTLDRIDAAHLSAASFHGPDLTLTARRDETSDATFTPNFVLFDAHGNLWASDYDRRVIFTVAPDDLNGAGHESVVPNVQIGLDASSLGGMAFDAQGSLWVPLGADAIGRITPHHLDHSTTAGDPTTVSPMMASPGLGDAHHLAFFPAAEGLPLHHSFDESSSSSVR